MKVIKLLNIKLSSSDELEEVIKHSHSQGIIDHETLVMLNGVLSIGSTRVRDVMIPKPSMNVINLESDYSTITSTIKQSLHSRYPVIDENNKAIGLLYVKDLINFSLKSLEQSDNQKDFSEEMDLKKFIRQVETVPETTKLPILLKQFRSGKNHLAIVIDEHEELAGLITIEDVLEQIVGEIRDEYDGAETIWIVDHGEQATVKGLTPLEAFNAHFKTNFNTDDGETVAGLILSHNEEIPKQGVKIIVEDFKFKVLKADSRRINLVSVSKITDPLI